MPSLTTILGADSRQFDSVMARAAATSLATSKQIATGLAATAVQLGSQIALAKRAGTAYAGYATKLAATNAQLTALNVQIAAQNALQAANTVNNAANATSKLGNAAAGAVHGLGNLSGILRESLVIVREFAAGRWSRIPSSISLLVQYLGMLKYLLNPIVLGLVAVGVATYEWVKHTKEMNAQLDATNQLLAEHNGRFEQAADAIKQNADNMREAAREAADYNEWLQKLGMSQESLVDVAEEHVKALQDEFQLQQEVAKQRGQTEGSGCAAEQTELKKELAEYDKDSAQANAASAKSLAEANAAEQRMQDFIKNKQENNDPISKLIEQSKKLDQIWGQLDPKVSAQMQKLRDIVSGKTPLHDLFVPGGQFGGGQTFTPQQQMSQAKETLSGLYQQYFGNLEVDGKKFSASEEQLDYAFADLSTKAKLNSKLQDDLAGTEEALKKALEDAKDKHQKDSEAVEELTKKRQEITDMITAQAEYDNQLSSGSEKEGSRPGVTDRERIGAAAAVNVNLSLLKTNQQHLAVSKQILEALKHGHMRQDGIRVSYD